MDTRKEVAYVAGKYRGSTVNETFENIMRARTVALQLWRNGYVAICPHLNTMLFDGECSDDVWLLGDLELLRRCDFLVLCPNWQDSTGACTEKAFAEQLGLPVYEWVEDRGMVNVSSAVQVR